MNAELEKVEDAKNRTVTGQWNHCPVARPAKTHQDFWRARVKRRSFRDTSGEWVTPPEFSIRMFHLGREDWFNLDTANQAAAAGKARDVYRCDCTWRNLHAWLREKGVRQAKAIHALRKESGSLIASHFGIEAARQHLGHRDIRTTSSHYVEKKKRIEIQLPLRTPNSVPGA